MTNAGEGSTLAVLAREAERTAIRARHGLKYLAGGQWAPTRPTPHDVVWRQGTVELSRYRNDAVRYADPIVMFIGLVSRSYILDLRRDNSLTKRLLDAGFDVYVLDWGTPTAADAQNTLETYTQRFLPRALRAALHESNAERASILGYCMGGNLALLGMATQRLPVGALVTMATPVDFTALPGLAGVVRERSIDPNKLFDWTGNVPAEYIASFFRARKPTADVPNLARLWENLWNEQYVESHQAMARWAREHVPFPGATYRQVADQWFDRNGFMTGSMRLAGKRVDLRKIDVPMLSVLATRDDLVPPEAARPIASLTGSKDFTLLEIEAGHAGLTTSRQAATTTVPALQQWLTDHNEPMRG